jgi:hypothetical protein
LVTKTTVLQFGHGTLLHVLHKMPLFAYSVLHLMLEKPGNVKKNMKRKRIDTFKEESFAIRFRRGKVIHIFN